MSADVFRLQEVIVNDEASMLENANSMGSNTYSSSGRIPYTDATVTLNQTRVADSTVQDRKNGSRAGYVTLRDGMLEITGYIPGVDGGVGAPTATWWHTLFGDGLGGKLSADDGGTISSSTDGDTFVTTGVTAITPGSIIYVGIKGDGRADGQPGAVSTWAAGATQLLTTLPGTPSAADVVRTCLHQYPTDTNPTVTKRFLVMHKTTGAVYQLLGCQLDGGSFEIPIADGGPIKFTLRWQCALWDQVAASSPASLPSGFTLPACDTAVIAGGSLYKQTVGTTTRALIQCSSLTLTLAMGLIAERGPAPSQHPYTNICGWVSTGCVPTITYTQPWLATEKADFDLDGSATVNKHFLFNATATGGRRFGFYIRDAYPVGNRPTTTNMNGLLHQTVSYMGRDSTVTTSELTRSAITFFEG